MVTFREWLREKEVKDLEINEANMAYYNFANNSKELKELADKVKEFIIELKGDEKEARSKTIQALNNKLMELIKK